MTTALLILAAYALGRWRGGRYWSRQYWSLAADHRKLRHEHERAGREADRRRFREARCGDLRAERKARMGLR